MSTKKILKIVVENLERPISRWQYIEYKHLANIVGKDRVFFTNIKDKYEYFCMKKITDNVYTKSINELTFKDFRLIILDPDAKEQLKPSDFIEKTLVLIGGIMGDFPPKHRTREYISINIKRENFKDVIFRNIGYGQFPIDMAGLIALLVFKGLRIDEINVVYGLEIQVNKKHSIYLPFTYPIIDGKPAISEEEIEYLKKNVVDDESILISLLKNKK